jgi:hypothetical protein
MLKNLQNDILLWVQARTGLSSGFVISLAVAGIVALLAFIFLCVTGYVWLSIELGPVFGGLAMAGVFLLIGVLSAAASALARDRTRHQAIVERAARAQGARALIDPKVLSIAMQAGRARLAAAYSAGLAGFSRCAMGAGSAPAGGHARSGYLTGLLAARNFYCNPLAKAQSKLLLITQTV